MALKFNIEPYWDDFNQPTEVDGLTPREKYNRILFRPGHAVQGRELTQIQSMLQNQIQAVGDHLFKDGSVVIPGNLHNNLKVVYIQVESDSVPDNLQDLQGVTLTSASDGVEAQVLHVIGEVAGSLDKVTLYIKYIDGSGVFSEGAILTSTIVDETTGAVLYNASIEILSNNSSGEAPNGFPSIGYASITSIDNGIYYIKKHFVVVQGKTIVLEKYGTVDNLTNNTFDNWSPGVSADIGLQIEEEIITPGEDGSLNDNAQGTPNESAPGAHRYKISAVFVTQPVNSATAGNFILLTRVQSGNILKQVRGTQYAVLEETLARRTFDESGNYTVNPFIGSFEPFDSNTDTTFELNVSASKGYVRGYEVQTESDTKVTLNKAREVGTNNSQATNLTHHNWIECAYLDSEYLPIFKTLDLVQVMTDETDTDGNPLPSVPTGVTFRIRSMRQSSKPARETDSSLYFKLDIFDVQGGNLAIDDIFESANFKSTISGVNLGNDSLVFPLPYERVQSCNIHEPVSYDYEVTFVEHFGPTTAGSGVVAFSVTAAGSQYFAAYVSGTYFLVDGLGALIEPSDYEVTFSIGSTNSNSGSSLEIISTTATPLNGSYRLVAPVISTLSHSSKSKITGFEDNFDFDDDFAGGVELSMADIIPNSVVILDGTADVTEYFFIDSGQRYTHYGLGSIRYLPGTTYQIQNAVTVTYDYFTHGGETFFVRDSYDDAIEYEDIPVFEGISLASAVDFRPLITKDVNLDSLIVNVPRCPLHNSYFKTDLSFYLGRIDKVSLKQDGTFTVIEGVSAEAPQAPSSPKDAMVLYTVNVPPYTMASGDLSMDYSDNRRYTMQDIGKIDRRIKKVEYQSVLSLLEKEASDRQIIEAGVSKFKTGFLVDSFLSSNVAYGAHPDYSAAIDPNLGILRPTYSEDNANLSLTGNTGDDLLNAESPLIENNGLNDGMLTLPYNEVNLITQGKYSSWTNVNPYNVFEWAGGIDLSPSSDDWKDTERRPAVVIDNDGVYEAMLSALEATNSTGTVWGNWKRVWSGISSSSVRNLAGISSGSGDAFNVDMRSSRVTSIVSNTVVTEIGDRVVSVELVPFMRSRIVKFSAIRMKPNTTVYPFFDGTNVSNYVNTLTPEFIPTVGINNIMQHPLDPSGLLTDSHGAVSGSLFIPNNNDLNFSTGSKVFRLTSDIDNAELNGEGTAANAIYTATGLLETVENVSISTRTPKLEVSAGANQYRSSGFWYDPIAQSFMIGSYGNDEIEDAATIDLPAGPGGAFITSIDVMFEKKDDEIPVQLQVREMVHGYPTMTVLPGGDVTINPEFVFTGEGEFSKFTFKHPVYLQDNIEYCFVLKASTDQYHARIAHIGEDDVDGNKITKQPYNGVFFKSANDSTWTPDQNIDIAFRVNRARFVSNSEVRLSNSQLPNRSLVRNPLTFSLNSAEVTVFCRNHGLDSNSIITINSTAPLEGFTHGILNSNLIGDFSIVANDNDPAVPLNITRDTFKITAKNGDVAAQVGIGGLNYFDISVNLRWNTLHPMIQEVILPNTLIDFSIQAVESSTNQPTAYASCLVNTDLATNSEYVINYGPTSTLSIKGNMSTTLNNLSPIIDVDRCSVATISNRINSYDNVPETDAVGGTNLAKYITKTVTLDDASDELKIYLDISRPYSTEVIVYYKLENTTDGFDQKPWIEAIGEVPFGDDGSYSEVEYSVRVGPGDDDIFSTFAIKIVMKSTFTGKIPLCKNLRAIAIID